MTEKPFVTYHVNTFNRLPLLANLLKSFEVCNVYDRFEWVVVDYGSTDGTRDFVYEYMKEHPYVSAVFSREDTYFQALSYKALAPRSKRFRSHAIFGLARNVARQVGRGDAFIDIADDHQFIRRGDWISDMVSVCEHHGVDRVSSVIYRGLWHNRVMKPNNERHPEMTTDTGVKYFIAKHKGYDDYHFMTRKMFERIGPYLEIERETDPGRIQDWKDEKETFDHYRDYLWRSDMIGLNKVFLKYPYAVDFPNGEMPEFGPLYGGDPIVPLFTLDEMVRTFGHLDRPVSSDELVMRRAI